MRYVDKNGKLTKECFESVLQSMAEGLLVVDASGVVRFCNLGLEAMTGMPASSIVGRHCHDIMVCACNPAKECGIMNSGSVCNAECQLKCADGTLIAVLKNGRAMHDENGDVCGCVETLTDISALKKAQRKNEALEQMVSRESGRFHLLIGKSRPMQQVFELVGLAAASQATVLVTGETGTGKELVARSIHEQGDRSTGPLVTVNCSALPESLLESELFGHAKGAFTGAIKDKIGRFEAADGGTLFLDEIGEISPFIQVKLLRFLQERAFERVGESVTRKADVRIITATNSDLRKLTEDGHFREDLFYRLKVFPIHLPPLRERKDDIVLLVRHFIDKYNKQTGKQIAGLSPEAALTIMDYCWPGNIRELENAIEHAFVTCREKEIGVFDLPIDIRHVELRSNLCAQKDDRSKKNEVKTNVLTKGRLSVELDKNNGNRMKTAVALGIDRTTLWRYIRRWNL
jgi:PAS domain S-box-containing protein